MKSPKEKFNCRCRLSHGFTLVETIIYIAIVGLFLTAFTFFALDTIELEGEVVTATEVSANAVFIAQLFERLIKEATFINEPSPAATSSELVLNHDRYGDLTIFLLADRLILADAAGNWPLSANQVRVGGLEFKRRPAKSNQVTFRFNVSAPDPLDEGVIIESTVNNRR